MSHLLNIRDESVALCNHSNNNATTVTIYNFVSRDSTITVGPRLSVTGCPCGRGFAPVANVGGSSRTFLGHGGFRGVVGRRGGGAFLVVSGTTSGVSCSVSVGFLSTGFKTGLGCKLSYLSGLYL